MTCETGATAVARPFGIIAGSSHRQMGQFCCTRKLVGDVLHRDKIVRRLELFADVI
jgi:hypothetical protein